MAVGPLAVVCGDGVNVSMTNEELVVLWIMEGRFRVGWGPVGHGGGPNPVCLYGTSAQVANALTILRATGTTSAVLPY
jgi:hypothetical protein